MRASRVLACVTLLALACTLAQGIQFDLGPKNAHFCLSDEFYVGQTFRGTYSVPDTDDHWDTALTVIFPDLTLVPVIPLFPSCDRRFVLGLPLIEICYSF